MATFKLGILTQPTSLLRGAAQPTPVSWKLRTLKSLVRENGNNRRRKAIMSFNFDDDDVDFTALTTYFSLFSMCLVV